MPETLATPRVASLAKKILAIMSEIGPLKKDKKNDFHKYQYASEELIMGVLRTLVIKHGVAIFPSQKSCSEIVIGENLITKVEMQFEIVDAETNETKVITFFGHGMDKGDKGIYKASTGAEKDFLKKQFMIAAEDDPEFDKNQATARRTYAQRQAAASSQKPQAEPSEVAQPPAPAGGKINQKIVHVFLTGVTLVKKPDGSTNFYKLITEDGQSWPAFTESLAKSASDFAKEGRQVAVTLDLNPRGPVVRAVAPL